MKLRTPILGLIAAVLGTVTLLASVPVGVYAVVDKVVFEPNDAEPQRVQIWGAFAVWDETQAAGYQAPARGYLYYTCVKEHLRVCRNEWADLKSLAGTAKMVGFGSRSLLPGRVRSTSDRAASPDTYPIQFGIVQLGSAPRGATFDKLRALARAK